MWVQQSVAFHASIERLISAETSQHNAAETLPILNITSLHRHRLSYFDPDVWCRCVLGLRVNLCGLGLGCTGMQLILREPIRRVWCFHCWWGGMPAAKYSGWDDSLPDNLCEISLGGTVLVRFERGWFSYHRDGVVSCIITRKLAVVKSFCNYR